MARKTGVPSIMLVARRMCNLIVKFEPIIIQLYPSNTALHAALSAAMAACSVLHTELANVREYGD